MDSSDVEQYFLEDGLAVFVRVESTILKLPLGVLVQESTYFAAMLASEKSEGFDLEHPIVLDGICCAEFKAFVKYLILVSRIDHNVLQDGIADDVDCASESSFSEGPRSMNDGDDGDGDETILVAPGQDIMEGHALEEPQNLHQVIHALKMSIRFEADFLRWFCVRRLGSSPSFRSLDTYTRLKLACEAGVARWLVPVCLEYLKRAMGTHARIRWQEAQSLGPRAYYVLVVYREDIDAALRYNASLPRPTITAEQCQLAGMAQGATHLGSYWYRRMSPLRRKPPRKPNNIKGRCEQVWEDMWERIVLSPLQEDIITTSGRSMEAALKAEAQLRLCPKCLNMFQRKVVDCQWLSEQERKLEREAVFAFLQALGFGPRWITPEQQRGEDI